MYKSICAVAVVLAAFTFVSGNRTAGASQAAPTSPPIVARAKLPNQTAAIPVTTLFTPTQDGLYRLSVYTTQTVSVPNSSASWGLNLFWTDDAGSEQAYQTIYQPVSVGPPNAFGSIVGGGVGNVLVLEMKAGQPLTYSTELFGGTDGGTYSLYFTLERLE